MLRFIFLALFIISSTACQSVSEIYSPKMTDRDKVLLTEVYKVTDELVGLCSRRRKRLKRANDGVISDSLQSLKAINEQNRVCRVFFRKWKLTPFSILLVTNDHEFLIGHPKPSKDFSFSETHEILGDIHYRPRTLSKNLLATYPAVNGMPTVVIGQPENTTVKSISEWIVVIMHEHFHQIQMSHPKYYRVAQKLHLAKNASDKGWMLDYPFPYEDAFTQKLFQQKGHALNKAYRSKKKFDFRSYLQRRKNLQRLLKKKDRKYLKFQMWQEGVARFIEMEILDLLSYGYKPSLNFRSLDDYEGFKIVQKRYEDEMLLDLQYAALKERERGLFYSFGAAEASLLHHHYPKWLNSYFRHLFNLDPLLSSAEGIQ